MTIPALRDATNDVVLRGSALTVYVWLLHNLLDPHELRPVKLSGLALALRMKRHTVSAALRTLTARGYLERQYRHHTGYAYRFYFVRRAVEVPPRGRTQPSP